MRLPMTLFAYISKHCLLTIGLVLAVVIGIIGLVETVELLRRTANKSTPVPFFTVLQMALMKLPNTAEKILPFAVLIGGMIAITRLNKAQELVVARAAGVSVWQFLSPALTVAALVGVIAVTLFNPLSAALTSRFEVMEGKYITGKASLLTISSSGLWLRQVDTEKTTFNGQKVEEYILHANRLIQSTMEMKEVTFFLYGTDNIFLGRVDAESATLGNGQWNISDTILSTPGKPSVTAPNRQLQTDLNIAQIQDSFASPKTLSFWEMPQFISVLQKAGFSALRHKLHFHTLLSTPLSLASMVLIAAIFSLRLPRKGKIGILIVAGIGVGFSINFLTNIVYALGLSGSLPIILAAWTPTIITMMLATTVLLHYEDG